MQLTQVIKGRKNQNLTKVLCVLFETANKILLMMFKVQGVLEIL
jgi:hypothetical protein